MSLGWRLKALQALSVFVALCIVSIVVAVYAEALSEGVKLKMFDFIPAAITFIALIIPASYAFRNHRQRNLAMMIACFVLVLILGSFLARSYAWFLAEGFSVRYILRGGFPNNVILLLGLTILTANAIVCLRSLLYRDGSPTT